MYVRMYILQVLLRAESRTVSHTDAAATARCIRPDVPRAHSAEYECCFVIV